MKNWLGWVYWSVILVLAIFLGIMNAELKHADARLTQMTEDRDYWKSAATKTYNIASEALTVAKEWRSRAWTCEAK